MHCHNNHREICQGTFLQQWHRVYLFIHSTICSTFFGTRNILVQLRELIYSHVVFCLFCTLSHGGITLGHMQKECSIWYLSPQWKFDVTLIPNLYSMIFVGVNVMRYYKMKYSQPDFCSGWKCLFILGNLLFQKMAYKCDLQLMTVWYPLLLGS